MKQTTLCLIRQGDQILLALKKRGFGQGKWNGYGGKPQENESLADCAVREMAEEIGITAKPADLDHLGRMVFHFENNPDWDQEVNLFDVQKWSGEPAETEEMRPQWFPISDIPFDQMWLEDKYWMPLFLAGKKFEGEFEYNSDGTKINTYNLREI